MTRNLLSLVILLAFALVASAQTEQGSWMVGGNISLNTASDQTEISLVPSAGYFFAKNFVAGANGEVTYTKNVSKKTTTLGLGPFARYYFGTMNIRPFACGELLLGTVKDKYPSYSSTLTNRSFFLGGGVAAFINRNVAIEGLAGYKRTKFEKGPGTGGFNLRIGFQVYLSSEQVDRLREINVR